MTDQDDKFIERIKKLLAKGNDPSVGEAEAALFMAKAQEMLEERNLSILDLSDEDRLAGIGKMIITPKYAGTGWRKMVATAAARVYMCEMIGTYAMRSVKSPGGKLKIVEERAYMLVGRESSVQVAAAMIDYLFTTVVRLSKGYSSHQKERHLFENGCGYRLMERLEELYKAHAVPSPTNPGNLPALYSTELALVNDWAKENVEGLRDASVKTTVDTKHSMAGAGAANNISLENQIGGGAGVHVALPKGALLLAAS